MLTCARLNDPVGSIGNVWSSDVSLFEKEEGSIELIKDFGKYFIRSFPLSERALGKSRSTNQIENDE